MAILPGTRVGPYEITAQIGAGGMGEVYRARDTKLGRDVAIKVLPSSVAADAGRMARFEREARLLAALNHSNIAAIYGVEESGGTPALVMELVEGRTLADCTAAGPIPAGEALPIAKQIADALEYAHEKGIIHRDLKLANIKVKADGTVKVLDFGLAKALTEDPAAADMNNSPTLTLAATMQGVILGTAAYMSPEQARGRAADKRTDIWAFGCVLYELLTGKQAFQGETATDIFAKILTGEPDWKALPAGTPAQIHQLLRRCLQKDRTQRLQAAGDARIEIQEALTAPVSSVPVSAIVSKLSGWRLQVLVGLAVLVAAGVAGFVAWDLKPQPAPRPAPVSRSVFSLPSGDRFGALQPPVVALSPDGSHLVYTATRSNTALLFLRAMDSFEARPIPGTDGATAPFFSPDGQWIGFFAGSKLKKISISGGAPVTLGSFSAGNTATSASWGTDNNIVFQDLPSGGLWEVSADGGAPRRLNTLAKGEGGNRWPAFLPGGKAVVYAATTSGGWGAPQIVLYRLDTGERRNLISGGTQPYYSPAGYLLYVQGGTLMGVQFDPLRMEVRGTPVPLIEGVMQSLANGSGQYSTSENGTLAYVPGGVQAGQSILVWVNRGGVEQPLPAPPHSYRTPRISPEGKRVAVVLDELGGNAWTYDLVRGTLTRLTFEAGGIGSVAWTRDGRRLVYSSGTPYNSQLWQLADGSGKAERLTASENLQYPISWSADGQVLAYMELDPNTSWDVWLLRLGDRKPEALLRTPSYESAPEFSPDGRWLAYVSDESGRFEIYVQPYPGPGGKWQISTDGGTQPVWNPNGRELFYRNGSAMMAVDLSTQPSFSAGKPRTLFEGSYLSINATIASYDVSPDGQRFIMLKASEQQQATAQINIVQNWFEELKQKVPTGKK